MFHYNWLANVYVKQRYNCPSVIVDVASNEAQMRSIRHVYINLTIASFDTSAGDVDVTQQQGVDDCNKQVIPLANEHVNVIWSPLWIRSER